MLYLVGAFLVGCVSARRSTSERSWPMLVVCVLVAAALYSRRFA
jgi:biotin transporter BioY